MIRKYYGGLVAGCVSLLAMAMLVPTTASAQDNERSWLAVRTIHVKGSKYDEFVELQKQLNAAAEAAGQPGRAVWQEIRGELGTFHIVHRQDNFAENDEDFEPPMDEEAWTAWLDATWATVSSSTRMVLRHHPEYSIPPEDDAAPSMLILRYTTVAPGKGGDFHNWVGDQLVPALKAGGAKGVNFNHVAFGGNTNLWVSGSRIDSWAELDEPGPLANMSDEDREALFANFGEMVWESDVRVLRYRADLSRDGPEE